MNAARGPASAGRDRRPLVVCGGVVGMSAAVFLVAAASGKAPAVEEPVRMRISGPTAPIVLGEAPPGFLALRDGAEAPRPALPARPLGADEVARLEARLDAQIAELTKQIAADPASFGAVSQRGDALFFRARFKEAVADYDRLVELDPKVDASHWRRGIAYYYNGQYKEAAAQFERYHTFDDVDRENGIWRYFSQFRADGRDKAQAGLLKYQKDDREPFPAIYALFEQRTTAAEILDAIRAAKIDETERDKRRFYASLYLGLHAELEDRPREALAHLHEAVSSPWGQKSSGGPKYMWHVGRIQYDLVRARLEQADKQPK